MSALEEDPRLSRVGRKYHVQEHIQSLDLQQTHYVSYVLEQDLARSTSNQSEHASSAGTTFTVHLHHLQNGWRSTAPEKDPEDQKHLPTTFA